jgi:hypothetical protein
MSSTSPKPMPKKSISIPWLDAGIDLSMEALAHE